MPEKHLARFIVEVVDGPGSRRDEQGAAAGLGVGFVSSEDDVGLLVYGVFSSRNGGVSFHRRELIIPIATRSRRFGGDSLGKISRSGRSSTRPRDGVPKMGTIGLDETKIHAKASRHSALSMIMQARLRRD
jgi:hypothetical protein